MHPSSFEWCFVLDYLLEYDLHVLSRCCHALDNMLAPYKPWGLNEMLDNTAHVKQKCQFVSRVVIHERRKYIEFQWPSRVYEVRITHGFNNILELPHSVRHIIWHRSPCIQFRPDYQNITHLTICGWFPDIRWLPDTLVYLNVTGWHIREKLPWPQHLQHFESNSSLQFCSDPPLSLTCLIAYGNVKWLKDLYEQGFFPNLKVNHLHPQRTCIPARCIGSLTSCMHGKTTEHGRRFYRSQFHIVAYSLLCDKLIESNLYNGPE